MKREIFLFMYLFLQTAYFTIPAISGNNINHLLQVFLPYKLKIPEIPSPQQEAWSSKWNQQKEPSHSRQPGLRLPITAQKQQGCGGTPVGRLHHYLPFYLPFPRPTPAKRHLAAWSEDNV